MSGNLHQGRKSDHAWVASGSLLIGLLWVLTNIAPEGTGWLSGKAVFTGLYMLAGIVLVLTVQLLWHTRPTGWVTAWIIGAGLVMRFVCFVEPSGHESDFYRYLWDGAVTGHGYNPYTIRPEDALLDRAGDRLGDPGLAALAERARPVLANVNHKRLLTIYPPVAQAVFALAYWLAPFSPTGLRAVFLGFDTAALAMLLLVLRRLDRPLHQAAIYWWNPILVTEFYFEIHMDAVVITLVLLAVVALMWRWRRSAFVLLGLAAGAKLWPVALAPLLLRQQARSARQWLTGMLLLGVTATVVLWPLLETWPRGQRSGLTSYTLQWSNNAGLYSALEAGTLWLVKSHILSLEIAQPAPRYICAGLWLAWLVMLTRRPVRDDTDLLQRCCWAVGGLFLVSPTQFPWYYTWLLPWLAVTPSLPLLMYTALLPLYNLHYDHPWMLWFEHLPVWLLLAWALWRHNKKSETNRDILYS